MLQLINIVLDSFPMNSLLVYIENIQLKQEITFWMVVDGLEITRTPKESH